MNLAAIRNVLLLILIAFLFLYIIIFGTNLLLRLTVNRELPCSSPVCQKRLDEAPFCLIKTPGSSECLSVMGKFYKITPVISYSLLFLSFILSYALARRFSVFQLLVPTGMVFILIFLSRAFLGATDFSLKGILLELDKTGLNIIGIAVTLFQLFNPKL